MKGNKRPTAMDYRGMVVSKDEDVIVPATEYFAQKNDPIVPILCTCNARVLAPCGVSVGTMTPPPI